ncbi:MAG: NAD(P)-dependent oxidoreductase [Kiritimatiellales bacterium]
MNIAVTGSSGFVGCRLSKRLEQAGHQVVTLDIASGVDLTNWGQVKESPMVDYVFHLAARTFVPAAFENPRSFYHTNLISTLNALELCRRNGARFVYASSYVYGSPKYLPVDEQHPTGAHNPYAQSKLIGEELCQAYWRDFSISSCILRPFNIYGPGQPDTFLIPEIIRKAREGSVCLKDSRPRRDFIYVDDVVEAYMACLNFSKTGVETFNIGSGESISVEEIAWAIAKQLSCDDVSFLGEHRPNEVLDTVADIKKAGELLHWVPRFSFREGIQNCLMRT